MSAERLSALLLVLGLLTAVWSPMVRAGTEELPLAHRYCIACHGLERLAYQRHTLAGWWWQVQRMRWLNGAAVPSPQVLPLARELARAYPAEGTAAWEEYAGLGLAPSVLAGLLGWRLWLRRTRRVDKVKSA